MNDPLTQRCNLIFAGQLLPGTDRDAARQTLAKFFGLKDASAVEGFFSGRQVPLRRGLPRSEALRLYRQLRDVGLICDIVDIPLEQPEKPPSKTPTPSPSDPVSETQTPPEAPSAARSTAPVAAAPVSQSRQARVKGPNLFALRPTPNGRFTPKERETAQLRSLVALVAAIALGVVVAAVTLRFPPAPIGDQPRGALATAALSDNSLTMLLPGALLIHERSGLARQRINAEELGMALLAPPLWPGADDMLLLNGDAGDGDMVLQRCSLGEMLCSPFLSEPAAVIAIASSYLGNQLYLLTADGELLLGDSDGQILARASAALPGGFPRLLSSDGLLLMPAAEGPLLGIYRPDQQQFGQQLDALLLMPQDAASADRIHDVALGQDYRWSLISTGDGAPGLYRFDRQWGGGDDVGLSLALDDPYLITWRDKLLVASAKDPRMLRFAADGTEEAIFESTLLRELAEEWLEQTRQRAVLRQAGIALPLLIGAISLLLSLMFFAQQALMTHLPGLSTALLDPMPAGIKWFGSSQNRDKSVNRLGVLLLAIAALPAIALASSGRELQGAMFAAAALGGVLCWTALRRGMGGFIGLVGHRAITVDHEGQYFYGESKHLRRCGNWLVAPGVPLPLRLGSILNIDEKTGNNSNSPLIDATPCSQLDLLGALWRRGHPWLHGGLYLLTGWSLSIMGIVFLSP